MRRIILPAAIVIAALSTTPAAGHTQSSSSDEQAVLAVVKKTFDGMRTRDTAMMRSLFDTAARLVTTATRNGQPVVRTTKMSDFIAMVGRAAPGDTE